MENPPDAAVPSYRTRNLVLAVIAAVMIIAAVVRLSQTPKGAAVATEAAAAWQPAAQTMPAPVAAAKTPDVVAGGAVDVELAYGGAVESLPDTAKVYVFIRPVGERMPLAVKSYAPKELPVMVEFSDPTDASAGTSVEVVARLSLTGSVTLQSGDSETISAAVRFGESQHLSLMLPMAAAAPATPIRSVIADPL